MKNMAFRVIDRLFIIVYGTNGPTDEEWVEYLKGVEVHGVTDTMQLIVTEGGWPSALQRRSLNEILYGRSVPVALMSDAATIRGVGVVLSWFNRKIKVFRPTDLCEALPHLGIPASRRNLIEHTIGVLRQQVAATT